MSASKIIQAAAGNAGAGISEPLITTYGDLGSTAHVLYSMAVDSENNIYACGYGPVESCGYVIKLNEDLEVQWQEENTSTSTNFSAHLDIAVDSTDTNLYVTGYVNESGETDGQVTKIGTNGTYSTNYRIFYTSSTRFQGISLDASDNILASGYVSYIGLVWHLSSSLSPISRSQYDNSESGWQYAYNTKVASDGDYFILFTDFGRPVLSRFSTTGSRRWNYQFGNGNLTAHSIAVDSSDNVYLAMDISDSIGGGTGQTVVKVDGSDGSIIWQRQISGPECDNPAVSIDSKGNVYALFGLTLVKYDSAGSIQYQRQFLTNQVSVGPNYLYKVIVDKNDDPVLLGSRYLYGPWIGKFPADGDYVGIAFNSYYVRDPSYTEVAGTLTDQQAVRSNFSRSGSSLNNSSYSYTSSDGGATLSTPFTPSSTSSTVQLVASKTIGLGGRTTQYTYTLADLQNSLQENDLVLLLAGNATSGTADFTIDSSGWTVSSRIHANDTYDALSRYAYKVMGSTPDTSILISPSGGWDAYDSWSGTVLVFRNIDTTTPLDVTPTSATQVNGFTVQPASITPTTSGALVVTSVIAAQATTNSGLIGFDPENTDYTVFSYAYDNVKISQVCGVKFTDQTFQANQVTGLNYSSTTNDSAAAWTIAIRPSS